MTIPAAAQNLTLDLDRGTRITSGELLSLIEKQTGYEFVIDDDHFDRNHPLVIPRENMNFEEAMDLLLYGSISYIRQGNRIVISGKQNGSTDRRRMARGEVVDTSGNPIEGVAVTVRGTTRGVATDDKGRFSLPVPTGDIKLQFSFLGMLPEMVEFTGQRNLRIVMQNDDKQIESVVVTGIFNRKSESYTGAAVTFSREEIARMGNTNLFESLKNLDASLFMLPNLNAGSDPNTIPTLQLRGASTFPQTDVTFGQVSVNQPLFILDGFESTAERIMDLDMSRIESVTILKDASSKALYGSRASNGVIVVETKRMTGKDVRVTYTGNLDIEIPDLTSYNLTNALEKLQVEVYEGLYDDASADPQTMVALRELYNKRLKAAKEGLDTYWLAKPLQTGVGHKHGISVELGRDALQCIADLQYKNVTGAMIGSKRNTITGDLNVSYKTKRVTFRNIMSIASNNSYDSPYGDFSDYAKMNPYWSDRDEMGHIRQFVDTDIPNPMYDAEINTTFKSKYLEFTNNFYVEWRILDGLKATSRIGINAYRGTEDTYYPAQHSRFADYSTEDELRKGLYDYRTTDRNYINGDLYLQYSKRVNKHLFSINGGFNIRQDKATYLEFEAEGFPNDRVISITEARQYAQNSTPSGLSTISREVGALGLATYSYDNRYLADFTLRSNASSLFGKDRRWATFWSAGLGWNIHNESFMKGVRGIQLMKLRFSVGTSGNQNFLRNSSIAYYSYYKDRYYDGLTASVLKNQGNPNLKWEQTTDYNVGLDFKYERLYLTADYYAKVTSGLIADIDIVPSTGFSTAKDNIGKVRNQGVEIKASYVVFQNRNGFFSLNANIATNDNRLIRISESMRQYNDYQNKLAAERNNNRPVLKYVDGMPMNAIWAVPSLGIDPATGNEIYLDRNGNKTFEWKAENMVMAGSTDPKYNGIAGFTGEYKGIGVNVTFTFLGGGQIYNQTLVDRVENIDPTYNVDRRVLSGRWLYPGQHALYKRLGTYRPEEGEGLAGAAGYTSNAYQEMTRATTRFVQDRNELNLSAVSVYYEFRPSLLKKLHLKRLRFAVNMNDICTFSSVKLERGLDYPFARTLSCSLIATF